MMQETQIQKEHIHFGHLGLILSVAVLLVGVSWMKNPNLFSVFKSKSSNSSISANLPRYYAYEPPAELSQPLVAGASTEGQGPMIINEDSSLSPAVEAGDVLGANTADLNLDLNSIFVKKVIADSLENIDLYIKQAGGIEDNYINNLEFESALSSLDPTMIGNQIGKMQGILDGLESINVPSSLTNFHKYKIIQYRAGIEVLRNISKADENPEIVSMALGKFLQAQQGLEQEAENMKTKFNLGN